MCYNESMLYKNYFFIGVVLAALGLGGFFVTRLSASRQVSVSATTTQADTAVTHETTQSSDTTQAINAPKQVLDATSEATQLRETPIIENANTATDDKSNAKDVDIKDIHQKEVPHAATQQQTNVVSGLDIRSRLVSFGFAVPSKPRTIDTIILHSSYDAVGNDPYFVPGVIAEWKAAGVAPHYLIDRGGQVYRLVKDADIAYHAGVSHVPDGRTNVNDFSLGIEMLNTKTDSYTQAQYAAVKQLITLLKGKYVIKYVLGHDAIAPGRKTDPWNFDWKTL